MNTLEQLAENYRTHRDRNPLPVDAETLEQLRTMTPQSVRRDGALLADCVTYENGQRLHWHFFRNGPALFLRLSTVDEYRDGIPTPASQLELFPA
jgi:hypothetical protein